MKNFLIALQFLTSIPVRIKNIDENKVSSSYFPLVGLLLGLILIGANRFLWFLGFEQFFINIILVILLIILTGGIHMDGLADTMDAFLSRKGKDEILRIMRDSRIGTMGVLSLVSIILLKIAFISSISLDLKEPSLILMCVFSRWSLVLSMFLFPYAREEGKAKIFVRNINIKVFIFSTVITILCAFMFWRVSGLVTLAVVALSAYIAGRAISERIGGITGDTLGAINEFAEIAVLFNICVLGRITL
ncbi:MAG: adenosylcobinamide-GDP ribazoletransferase [Candidatus Omnitrophica bacterium]|nr:adenosylcobinamide-GDP ribazoletransferase [Candidatus Omnitrophota bacterium]